MEKAHSCRLLTKAFTKPYPQGHRQVQHSNTSATLSCIVLIPVQFSPLPGKYSVFPSINWGPLPPEGRGACSELQTKINLHAHLHFSFLLRSGGFINYDFFYKEALLASFTCDFASLYNQFLLILYLRILLILTCFEQDH